MGRELSQDGPLLGSPEGENHVLDQNGRSFPTSWRLMQIQTRSHQEQEGRNSGNSNPKEGEIPLLGHNLSLPSPIERKEKLSVLTKQGVKVVFGFHD